MGDKANKMNMDGMLVNIESFTDNANKVKDIVLKQLAEDKLISPTQQKEYSENWQVIIIKLSWFKRYLKAFRKDENPEAYEYKFVKFES